MVALGILALLFIGVVASAATQYMAIASFSYFLLVLGFFERKKNRLLHIGLMSLGMLIDLSLVLTLELKRSAIATAVALTLTPWQQAHVLASTLAVVLYFPVFYCGLKRWQKPRSSLKFRLWHLRLGYAAFVLRSLGFLLMFSLLGRATS